MGGNEEPFRGNFYPRSPCGERPRGEHHANSQQEFLSTLSLRRATNMKVRVICISANFYPRSPCGERLGCYVVRYIHTPISIHALLAESDDTLSIHIIGFSEFLSTLSLRRATASNRKERQRQHISIHALLAESDFACAGRLEIVHNFYPRSPCGERRIHYDNYNLHCVISIHALLAESDGKCR